MEKLKQTIAVIFRRKGKTSITEKEFVFSASIDMRWFTPKSAQKLLDMALQMKLLSKSNGELTPNFNLDEVEVPLEFKPTEDILDVRVEDLLSRLLTKLQESRLDRKELAARMNALQAMYGIEPEAAALVLGNDVGVDLKEYIPSVEEEIAKRAKG